MTDRGRVDKQTGTETTRTSVWSAGVRTRLRLSVAIVGLIAATFLLAVGALALTRSGESLPGVTIAGRDAGGMDADALAALVEDLARERQQAQTEVTAAGSRFTFVPGGAGYVVDVDTTVDAALQAGRGSRLDAFVSHVTTTFGNSLAVDLVAEVHPSVVDGFLDDVATVVERPASPGGVTVDPETLEVDTTAPQAGRELDREAASARLVEVIGDPDPAPVTLDLVDVAAPTDPADVEAAAARAAEAVAEPIRLEADGGQAVLEPAETARILRSTEQDGDLVLVADPDALAEVMAEDLPTIEVEPVDAGFEVRSEIPVFDDKDDATWSPRPADVAVVPSSPGARFDAEDAAEQIGALLEAGRHEGELELEVVPASLTTEDAEQLGVTDLIGTFTTYHACCQNRVTNIQRLADLVRGTVLRPGEDFSINRDIGPRTRAKGFVADGAIVRGELVDEVGGGVSQFATTTYNAAFWAGIPILEHQAHSFYISRYPLGREATLNYDTIDLRILNDTEHGIYIHTSYTPTSITVSLFGDNGGREVTGITGSPTNHTAFSTRRRPNPNLPQGVERVVQSGIGGYDVRVQRIIREDGEETSETIFTRYVGRPRIVEVGTGAPPPPPPDPTPEPSPSDSATPSPTPDDSPDPEPSASES